MSSNDNMKKPFKLVEIPVNNFKDVAIPHHLNLLAEHKNVVQKENHDSNKMRSETVSIKRVLAQLKGLLYELDTLRAQVEDSDLDRFDMKTVSLRKSILQIISEYAELQKHVAASFTPSPKQQSIRTVEDNETTVPHQLQLSKSIDELKLEQKEACLENIEKIETDIQDLHSVYGSLHEMVVEQKENVDAIEENVEDTHVNVNTGVQHILTAARLKASVYPVTGAVIGTCVGGPLGLIAGLKVGGLAAFSFGILGFMGGKVMKKRKLSISELEVESSDVPQENNDNSKNKKEE